MGRFDLALALTMDCHTDLCFYGHPRQYRVQYIHSLHVLSPEPQIPVTLLSPFCHVDIDLVCRMCSLSLSSYD